MPKFKIEREERGDRGPLLVLFISVSHSDINRNAIVALSCHLSRSYSSEQSVIAWIFDSKKAAKTYNPQGEGNSKDMLNSFIGDYGFSKNPPHPYHSLAWYEVPGDPQSVQHIDLGPPPNPQPNPK